MHGHGAYEYPNGNRYEGEWKEGKQHGHGTYTWADGTRYEGEFKEGKQHGKVIEYRANGNRFEGEYEYGKAHGSGIKYFSNGDRFEGKHWGGERDGPGTFYRANGDRFEGEWCFGLLHGKGIEYFANGDPPVTRYWYQSEEIDAGGDGASERREAWDNVTTLIQAILHHRHWGGGGIDFRIITGQEVTTENLEGAQARLKYMDGTFEDFSFLDYPFRHPDFGIFQGYEG